MIITDLEPIALSYPLPEHGQYRVGRMRRVKYDCLLVRVHTEEGIVGIGESCLWIHPSELARAVEDLKPRFVGRSPFDVAKLTIPGGDASARVLHGTQASAQETTRLAYTLNSALAAIDVACWDIVGKATDTPVYKLLSRDGDYQTTIRGYASAGVFYEWYSRPEQIVDEALRWIDEGWTAHKLRMGTDWTHDDVTVATFLDLMEKVAQAVNGRMDLMVDAGSRCRSLEEALDIARGLQALGFLWFEEPLPRAPEQNAALASQVDILITGGEGFVSPPQFAPYLEQGAYDVVQPDSSRTGLTGWMKVASLAERYGKTCIPHTWFNGVVIASNVHGVAAIPNRMLMEYNANHNPLKHEILVDPIMPEEGTFHLSEKPGLGIELDESALARFPYVEGTQYVPLAFPE